MPGIIAATWKPAVVPENLSQHVPKHVLETNSGSSPHRSCRNITKTSTRFELNAPVHGPVPYAIGCRAQVVYLKKILYKHQSKCYHAQRDWFPPRVSRTWEKKNSSPSQV